MSDLMYAIKRRRLRRGRSRLAAVILLTAGALLLWLAVAFYRHFMPIVTRLAEAEANNLVSAVVNNAIAARIAEGELKYNDIIRLEKNESGAISAVMTDTAKVNLLKAAITKDVIEAFADDMDAEINIPLGNLTGVKLLSGKGPAISVELVPAAQTNTEFLNQFSSAGINQTCHRIIVRVDAGVNMMLPGKDVFTRISAEVAVAETIIIGDVPDSYTFFEADEKWDENIEQYDILS